MEHERFPRMRSGGLALAVRAGLTALVGLTLIAPTASGARAAEKLDGHRLYVRHCEACHGSEGRGDGPDAALFVTRPRDLHDGVLTRYPTDDLVRRIRTGAPLALALDAAALKARATDTEAIVAHLERLPGIDWRLTERGQELFVDRCELCHGPNGQPGPDVPPGVHHPRDLTDPAFQRSIDDDALAALVRHGRHGMPALTPRIPESDLPALVAFVRLLSPGFVLYDRYCTACHGEDGRGAGSFAEGTPRPTVVFDRDYFRRHDPEQVRASVWHMLATQRPTMPHLRRSLSAAQARAIIAYLKQHD